MQPLWTAVAHTGWMIYQMAQWEEFKKSNKEPDQAAFRDFVSKVGSFIAPMSVRASK
jgi:hypothetical protein